MCLFVRASVFFQCTGNLIYNIQKTIRGRKCLKMAGAKLIFVTVLVRNELNINIFPFGEMNWAFDFLPGLHAVVLLRQQRQQLFTIRQVASAVGGSTKEPGAGAAAQVEPNADTKLEGGA